MSSNADNGGNVASDVEAFVCSPVAFVFFLGGILNRVKYIQITTR
jgi:hypothetical protein